MTTTKRDSRGIARPTISQRAAPRFSPRFCRGACFGGQPKPRLAARLLLVPLIAVLVGCAAAPEQQKKAAYDAYWQCAQRAAEPYAADPRYSPRVAALWGQTHCKDRYDRFRKAQVNVIRSKLNPDSSDLADQLGDREAFVSRQRVTAALARDIAASRAAAN